MNQRQRDYLAEGERAGMRYALGLPRQAPRGHAGVALAQHSGNSLEFREYRDYQAGDDIRHIDWSAYARSDQYQVKLFREEVTPHLDLLIDGSRSMALPESAKERGTVALAAFFAAAAENAGYSHAGWILGKECAPIIQGSGAPATWEEVSFTHPGNPADSFRDNAAQWRPRGMRVFLSDLLWPVDPRVVLASISDRASTVVVIQILARADAEPPTPGSYRLVDSETGIVQEVHIDAAAAKTYAAALARHQQEWFVACRELGATMTTIVAEQFVENWQLDELVAAEVLKVV